MYTKTRTLPPVAASRVRFVEKPASVNRELTELKLDIFFIPSS